MSQGRHALRGTVSREPVARQARGMREHVEHVVASSASAWGASVCALRIERRARGERAPAWSRRAPPGASSTIMCALNDKRRTKRATTDAGALSAAALNAIVCATNGECAESAAM